MPRNEMAPPPKKGPPDPWVVQEVHGLRRARRAARPALPSDIRTQTTRTAGMLLRAPGGFYVYSLRLAGGFLPLMAACCLSRTDCGFLGTTGVPLGGSVSSTSGIRRTEDFPGCRNELKV